MVTPDQFGNEGVQWAWNIAKVIVIVLIFTSGLGRLIVLTWDEFRNRKK